MKDLCLLFLAFVVASTSAQFTYRVPQYGLCARFNQQMQIPCKAQLGVDALLFNEQHTNQLLLNQINFRANGLRDLINSYSTQLSEKFNTNISPNLQKQWCQNQFTVSQQQLNTNVGNLVTNILNKIKTKSSEEIKKLKLNEHFTQKCSEEIKTLNRLISRPFDCLEILESGQRRNGIYSIYPEGHELDVYCDMTTNGGGWTVFLHRGKQESQLDFRRNWQDYTTGFGSPSAEYWLGTEALHLMTSRENYSLRIDVKGNETHSNAWAEWTSFQVQSADLNYQLTVKDRHQKSTMVDTFGFGSKGQNFTIFNANDKIKLICGGDDLKWTIGGFWFNTCSSNYPTAIYGNLNIGQQSGTDNIRRQLAVSSLQMKIRRNKTH